MNMRQTNDAAAEQLGRDWWQTAIIDMQPGVIRYRGYAIEDLIRKHTSLAQMVWLLTRGELPTAEQGRLLEAALMAGVDHGPQAPSIAITRMAATCGVGINSAMASGLNVLGDVHGGAGEQALALYQQVALRLDAGSTMHDAVRTALDAQVHHHGKAIPGFDEVMGEIPQRVFINNDVSPDHTVAELQLVDRLGLLYDIFMAIGKLGLSVTHARICTEKGVAIDAIYIQTANGDKIRDKEVLDELKETLEAAVFAGKATSPADPS